MGKAIALLAPHPWLRYRHSVPGGTAHSPRCVLRFVCLLRCIIEEFFKQKKLSFGHRSSLNKILVGVFAACYAWWRVTPQNSVSGVTILSDGYFKSIQFRQFEMHFISKKKYNKKCTINLHTKQKDIIFHNKNQFLKVLLQFEFWFFPKTPSSHISLILSLCQAFYYFVFRRTTSIYCKSILYYVIRCEQMFLFAKLFSKTVDISKTRKDRNFKF